MAGQLHNPVLVSVPVDVLQGQSHQVVQLGRLDHVDQRGRRPGLGYAI